jgi:hypothetical protein
MAHGPCFELTEHSNALAPLATSGDLGQGKACVQLVQCEHDLEYFVLCPTSV